MELPGQKPPVVNRVVVGEFEEEEEGIGIAIDVVKVKGEDPASPGCLREDKARRYVGDSQSFLRAPLARFPREETPGP